MMMFDVLSGNRNVQIFQFQKTQLHRKYCQSKSLYQTYPNDQTIKFSVPFSEHLYNSNFFMIVQANMLHHRTSSSLLCAARVLFIHHHIGTNDDSGSDVSFRPHVERNVCKILKHPPKTHVCVCVSILYVEILLNFATNIKSSKIPLAPTAL